MGTLDLLARTHGARLNSFLQRRVGNSHDVEDLVQDTFLEAVRCIEQFHGQSQPGTWLFGIALNLTRAYYRRAKMRDIYSTQDIDLLESNRRNDPSQIAEGRERMSRLIKAVEELPPESYRLLELVIDTDLSYDKVAEQLGIPIGTVRSRISRARASLKRQVDGSEPTLNCTSSN